MSTTDDPAVVNEPPDDDVSIGESPDGDQLNGDQARWLLTNRRKVLIGLGTLGSVAAIAEADLGGSSGGNLYGGTMALEKAYKVGERAYLGPESVKDAVISEIPDSEGWKYETTDTDNEYWLDNNSWQGPLGLGSSSKPAGPVHTEDAQIDSLDGDWDYLATTGDELVDIVNNQAGAGDVIAVVGGTITYDTTLSFDYDEFKLKGVGRAQTILEYTGTGNGIDVQGASADNLTDWELSGFTLKPSTRHGGSIGIDCDHASRGTFRDLSLTEWGSNCLTNDYGNSNTIVRCRFDDAANTNVKLNVNSFATTVRGSEFVNAGLYGLQFTDATASSVESCIFEDNASLGLYVNASGSSFNSFNVSDSYFETNLQDTANVVVIKASAGAGTEIRGMTVRGCYIVGNGPASGEIGVAITDRVACTVQGGSFRSLDTGISDRGSTNALSAVVEGVSINDVNTPISLPNVTNKRIGVNDT